MDDDSQSVVDTRYTRITIKQQQQQLESDMKDHELGMSETEEEEFYEVDEVSEKQQFDISKYLPKEYQQRDFKAAEQATDEMEVVLNQLYASAAGDILSNLRLSVTVGIKTFNRPSCALNLVKSILFYYPGLTITIVNDGELPVNISETSWDLFDPLGSSNAVVSIDLDVVVETVDDTDLFMQQETERMPVVLDQSQVVKSQIRIINIPFDSGVSVGRNVLVHSCKTKYILMTDDDYQFLPETDLGLMMRIMELSEIKEQTIPLAPIFAHSKLPIDVIGGIRSEGAMASSSKFPRGSNFELETTKIVNMTSDLGLYEHLYKIDDAINILRINPSWDDATKDLLSLEKDDSGEEETLASLMFEGNCLPTQFIQQFFMARVATFEHEKIFWDPHLKNNDHYDFFLRASGFLPNGDLNRKISILGCSAIRYSHAKTSKGACAADTKTRITGTTYMDFRNRWVKYIPYLFQKWNVGMVIDDEIKKTIVVSRDKKLSNKCHVLELRTNARLNKDYTFEC